MYADLAERLAAREAAGLYRRRRVVDVATAPLVRVDGRELLAFCSNDYLGLANDPRVIAALCEGARRYGVGSGASHLVCGHTPAHHALELDELRVLAHLSKDERLVEAFATRQDVHTHTASVIFDVPRSEVTAEMRRRSKTINFGVIYGMGEAALATQLGISRDEASRFIAAYFHRYEGVRAFMERTVAEARVRSRSQARSSSGPSLK